MEVVEEDTVFPPLGIRAMRKLRDDMDFLLERKKCVRMRRAVMGDFMATIRVPSYPVVQHERPKNYRIQDEYGEKKFIKP